jgi:hypothetical protein
VLYWPPMHTARSMQLPRTALLPASHATQRVLLVASGIELSLHSIHSVPSKLEICESPQSLHIADPAVKDAVPDSQVTQAISIEPADFVLRLLLVPAGQESQGAKPVSLYCPALHGTGLTHSMLPIVSAIFPS